MRNKFHNIIKSRVIIYPVFFGQKIKSLLFVRIRGFFILEWFLHLFY